CLVDEIADVLMASPDAFGQGATALDLLRGIAWLASFPLLTHGLWSLLEMEGEGRRPNPFWLVPGYATLALFVPAASQAWQTGSYLLAEVAKPIFPLILLHVTVASAASAWMVLRWLRLESEPRFAQFLRWLLAGLGVTVALVAAGALLLRPGEPGWAEAVWRLAVELSGLVLGLTFLYFVQRYNLLRLSMSYRSLRRFLGLVGLVGMVMLVGTVLGAGGTPELRRIVAWGILAALLAAAVYTPLQQAALRRFAWLRRLLGVSITAEELEGLTRQLQSFDLPEERMRELTAGAVGRWLATRARFLGPEEQPALWACFAAADAHAFNRLDAPTPRLASLLQRADLQAAFPLRVGGALAGVLVVVISPAAGGYQEGDMETVQIVLRQLAGSLELRRLLEARLAAERTLAERERLSLLGMVAASLAHELKNPLSGMKALAQTVREELAAANPESEQARDLELIVEQIDRLDGVSHEILGFARAPERDGEGVELTALLRGTLYVLGHQARRRGIELDASGVEEVGRVNGTSATWQTVLLNLLLNAAQHAPAGSTVGVRLHRDGRGIVFATENAGPAIPPEIAGRLFQPFVRKGEDGGTGLGLPLVAQRVGELGGTIEVVNEPGRIVFQVCLREPGS
ncbi:MAG TPA: HAMP domain-containing sensor histidine kinase, partial [Thermoanaerobaculia bacterium]